MQSKPQLLLGCFIYGTVVTMALPSVQINGIRLDGVSQQEGSVDAFLGIQYAVVGERFSRGTIFNLPNKTSGTYDASEFGPNCHQSYRDLPEFLHTKRNEAEECLYLNVWRPANASSEPLPVMFWIHGGGFALGSGADEVNQGHMLAANQDVMVVTINYRLGALGFMAQDTDGYGGMNGLHDQILALEWVQEYTEYFGGDKDRITVFGGSAGGESICMLSVSPRAQGLFHRAILQSGECVNNNWMYGVPTDDFVLASTLIENLLNITGADSLEELKNATKFPADEFNAIAPAAGWPIIVIDRELLPEHPSELYKNPINVVPSSMMIGSNSYEDAMFLAMAPSQYIAMAASIEDAISSTAGVSYGAETALEAISAYNASAEQYNGDMVAAYAQYHGDFYIRCPSRAFARTLTTNNDRNGDVYLYNFAHNAATDPMNFFGLQNFVDTSSWASHLAEIPFVFGTLERWLHHNGSLTEEDWMISYEMQYRWAAFAKNGNPNPNVGTATYNLTEWLPFLPSGQTLVYTAGRSDLEILTEKDDQCAVYPYFVDEMIGTVTDFPPSAPTDISATSSSIICTWLLFQLVFIMLM